MNSRARNEGALDPVDIFAKACAAPAGDRSRIIEDLCAGDDVLRENIIAMVRSLDASELADLAADRQLSVDAQPGTVIDERYQLIDLIGEGATASVWRAWDRKMTRDVALKLFDAPSARREWEQVIAEARAVASVYSDHVVRVHNTSDSSERDLYIDLELCCEWVDGEPVPAEPLSRVAPRSLHEAVLWLEQAARGIHAAHRKAVYHRDLKPQNVLVEVGSRALRVTDFGHGVLLAGGIGTASRNGTSVLHEGNRQIVGTPPYMAPEQAKGLTLDPRNKADQRSLALLDVYGLGAVGFFILAGRAPYPWPAEMGLREMVACVRNSPPAPLRARERFRLPGRLRRVIGRAMARDPSARYESAAALADDLKAFREDHCPSHDRSRYALRGALWIRRNKLALSTLAAVLTFVTAVAAMRMADSRRERAEKLAVAAELRAQKAHESQAAAEAAMEVAQGRQRAAEEAAEDADRRRERAVADAAAAKTAEAKARVRESNAVAETGAAHTSETQAVAARDTALHEAAQARLEKAQAEEREASAEVKKLAALAAAAQAQKEQRESAQAAQRARDERDVANRAAQGAREERAKAERALLVAEEEFKKAREELEKARDQAREELKEAREELDRLRAGQLPTPEGPAPLPTPVPPTAPTVNP